MEISNDQDDINCNGKNFKYMHEDREITCGMWNERKSVTKEEKRK